MPFDRIAAVFAAVVSPMVMPHSKTRPPSSSSSLSDLGQTHHIDGWNSDPGQRKFLRLSSSLQDLPKLDPEIGDPGDGLDREYAYRNPRYHLLKDNGGTSFSKEKSTASASFLTRRKWVRIIMYIVCLLLVFSVIYLCFMYLSGYLSQTQSNYNVIIDCGSTGTRVYVYEWSVNPKKRDGRLPIALRSLPKEGVKRKSGSKSGRAYQRMETEPGFDRLVRNESGLRAAMLPLLRWAEKQIPKHAHKKTSVYLYGTAGVRRLPTSDSDWLLGKAFSILKDSSSFLCHKEWVKTISGMEEAYYGWIALNYHMNALGSVPSKETYGSLDLGGSSLQVTFETKEASRDGTSLKLSIGDIKYYLSAYSLSGYGLNDAFEKSVVHLVRQFHGKDIEELKSGRLVLKHPCLQAGYKEQYSCSQCSMLNQEGSPSVGGKGERKGRKGMPIHLVGAPNWEECRALAKVAVNFSEWTHSSPGINCDIRPCALANNLTPPHGQFSAMSGFFVVFKFFNLTSKASPDELLLKGEEFCEKTWEVAKKSVNPQPFIERYCFRAPYVASLLRDGLHIRDSDVVIGSGSITWTLGVALLEAGRAFSSKMEFPAYRILPRKFNILFVIMVLMLPLVVFCALSLVGNWVRRSFRRTYLPLFRHNSATSGSVRNISSPLNMRWSPINSGDGRVKMPLSPVAASQQHSFGLSTAFGGSFIQPMGSSADPSAISVSHSQSSGSLGQMHTDNVKGSFWSSHRSQMQLQSRRSQSREDLSSSLADAHLGKS